MKNQNNFNEATRWLQQAKHDLKVAAWNIKGEFCSDACFMAQQAGEKALKAYCYAQGERNVLGHALLVLARRCAKYEGDFSQLFEECKRLDKYYIIARYPNGLPDLIPAEYFDSGEARKALAHARSIMRFVKEQIKQMEGGK